MSGHSSMDETLRSTLLHALYRLFTPLVRILLRHGIAYGTFAEVAKRVYVHVAMRDFALPGKKQTDSRVAVLTGLIRQEVKKIRDQPEDPARTAALRENRVARVLNGLRGV